MADSIKKTIHIKSPVSRVWRALTDSKEYGTWFQCKVEGPFEVGKTLMARMTLAGVEHLTFPLEVLKMEENKRFTLRWPAYVEKTDLDLLQEPWLVTEFHLKETVEGTEVTVIESGFDRLNAAIQEEARRGNEGGWEFQLKNLCTYLNG